MFFEMRFDLGTLDSGERSLPFGLLVNRPTDRSKEVLLLWFLTVACSCCPYLYFGSPFM